MNKIPVEQYINIYDKNILWYSIPGFPSYELSNTGYIRSFKWKKYPYGVLIKQNQGICILSNLNNQRIQISISDIQKLIQENHIKPVYGYQTEYRTRNPRSGILPDAEVKYGKLLSKPVQVNNEKLSYPDFSQIPKELEKDVE